MIRVLFFGELSELTGTKEWHCPKVENLVALKKTLFQTWPALNSKTFSIAINKKMANDLDAILDNDEIAIMPPFSGG